MATASFERRFYVSKSNVDEFVETVTKKSASGKTAQFQSRYITGEKLKKYSKGPKQAK